jgi:hypothetical protein
MAQGILQPTHIESDGKLSKKQMSRRKERRSVHSDSAGQLAMIGQRSAMHGSQKPGLMMTTLPRNQPFAADIWSHVCCLACPCLQATCVIKCFAGLLFLQVWYTQH